MTPAQAAEIIATFHGAYPQTRVDEAVVEVWNNSLATANFDAAKDAANEWITTNPPLPWPSIAAFNGFIRRRTHIPEELPVPSDPVELDREAAFRAFVSGYRRGTTLGGTGDEIEERARAKFTRWWPDRASGAEPDEPAPTFRRPGSR